MGNAVATEVRVQKLGIYLCANGNSHYLYYGIRLNPIPTHITKILTDESIIMIKNTINFQNLSILFICVPLICSACNGHVPNSGSVDAQTKIQSHLGDTVTQIDGKIWCIFQDQKQNYWFGSDGHGIYRYDGTTLVNFTTKDGLSNDSIRQIQEDKLGHLFISTLVSIDRFDGQQFTKLEPVKSKDWKLDPNDMWFNILGKRNENGPYRFDGTTLYQMEFPPHEPHDKILERTYNPFFSPYEVYCIYKDRSGAMWFGTSILGACRYDGQSIQWMYEEDLTIAPSGGTFGIRSIFEDRTGKFWLCNTNHRYAFDFTKNSADHRLQYTKEAGVGDSKLFHGDAYIYFSYIVEDHHNNLWLTTWDQGVYKFDGQELTHYPVMDGANIANLVSMYKDHQGVLWLGTNGSGVYRFDGDAFVAFKN